MVGGVADIEMAFGGQIEQQDLHGKELKEELYLCK